MDYAETIESLTQRAHAIDGRLAALGLQRKEFALGAAQGNPASVTALADISRQETELFEQQRVLSDAVEQARHLEAEQKRAIENEANRKRAAETSDIARAVLKVDANIDTALAALRELFEQRKSLIRSLDTEVVSPRLILRMLQTLAPTAAARAAGLRPFLDLEHVEPCHVGSLAQCDNALRGYVIDATTSKAA